MMKALAPMKAAAFSAIMTVTAATSPPGIFGITEASAIRSPLGGAGKMELEGYTNLFAACYGRGREEEGERKKDGEERERKRASDNVMSSESTGHLKFKKKMR